MELELDPVRGCEAWVGLEHPVDQLQEQRHAVVIRHPLNKINSVGCFAPLSKINKTRSVCMIIFLDEEPELIFVPGSGSSKPKYRNT
jgi:hypothetical protein